MRSAVPGSCALGLSTRARARARGTRNTDIRFRSRFRNPFSRWFLENLEGRPSAKSGWDGEGDGDGQDTPARELLSYGGGGQA